MKTKVYLALAVIILSVLLVLRLIPISQNNFYFTVDQGRDAVYVREILQRHQLLTKGPETTIRGIFTGPLWYYFLAIGYGLFGGDPRGGVVTMVALNLGSLGLLMWAIGRRIGRKESLIVGLALTVSWPFYESSAYAFNPFPLVSLGLGLVLFLEKKWLPGALLVVFLALNANLAGATAFLLVVVFFWAVQRLDRGHRLMMFSTGLGIFSGTDYLHIGAEFLKIVGGVVFPWNAYAGCLIFGIVSGVFLIRNQVSCRRRFVLITLFILLISYLFFGASRGWRDWQSVYLAPIMVTSFVLCVTAIKSRWVKLFIISVVLISQLGNFWGRYFSYPGRTDDQGILGNQLKVLDWVYQHSGGQGFGVYTYTKDYLDYPEQYLFWWYGIKRYGFVPCEYSNLPGTDKQDYIPGSFYYLTPKKDCGRVRFLIIRDPENGEKNKDWITSYQRATRLVEVGSFGSVRIEKRELTEESDILFDTNINLYDYWVGPLHLRLPNGWERFSDKGMSISRFRTGEFLVGGVANGKGCLGNNLEEFREKIARLQGGVVSSSKDLALGKVPAYWVEMDIGGKERITTVLFRGEINDYFVGVYRRGVLAGADMLTQRLLKSVVIAEDSGTKTVKSCVLGSLGGS